MQFEWDPVKSQSNMLKHGIDFDTAILVFLDEYRIEKFDEVHSTINEERFITIGEIRGSFTVIVVAYTIRLDHVRVISARKATSRERKVYYECEKRS